MSVSKGSQNISRQLNIPRDMEKTKPFKRGSYGTTLTSSRNRRRPKTEEPEENSESRLIRLLASASPLLQGRRVGARCALGADPRGRQQGVSWVKPRLICGRRQSQLRGAYGSRGEVSAPLRTVFLGIFTHDSSLFFSVARSIRVTLL